MSWTLGFVLLVATGASLLAAPAELRSGPQVGERTLPFTSNAVTGPDRGKQHCYICEMKDETAVLVFARRMDDPTSRLIRGVRDQVKAAPKGKAFGWFVFLGTDEAAAAELALERQAYDFARQNGCTNLPITAMGDPQGPPGYLINREADTTVIVFRSGKVLANRSFRTRDWNNRAADGLLKELPAYLGK
jgi:hypothetical protein